MAEDTIVGISIIPDSDDESVEVDITARQKMLSAVTGSLLTSLLGEDYSLTRRIYSSVATLTTHI